MSYPATSTFVTSVCVYNTRASCKLTTSIMTACFFFIYNIHQQFFYIKVQKCVFLVNIKLKLKNGNMPKSIQIATYNNTRIHKIFIKGKANGISFTSATFRLTCNIFSIFFLAYTHSKNKSNHSDILINHILRSLYAIILRLFFSRTQQQYLDTSYSMDISFTFVFTSIGCQQKQTFLAHTHEIYEV